MCVRIFLLSVCVCVCVLGSSHWGCVGVWVLLGGGIKCHGEKKVGDGKKQKDQRKRRCRRRLGERPSRVSPDQLGICLLPVQLTRCRPHKNECYLRALN